MFFKKRSFSLQQKSQLKSDREKEIQEFLAQIDNKYNLKIQEAEAEYSYKKNGLEKNRSKILMNQLLAECFSAVCVDPFLFRGIHQGMLYISQYLVQKIVP